MKAQWGMGKGWKLDAVVERERRWVLGLDAAEAWAQSGTVGSWVHSSLPLSNHHQRV